MNISMHNDERPSFIATAALVAFVPVKLDVSNANQVVICGAGDAAHGFSHDNVDAGVAVGLKIGGYFQALIGIGGWTYGQQLKVGASGTLIAITSSDDVVVAIAMKTVSYVAGNTGEIYIVPQIESTILSGMLTTEITLTTAQILALNTTPIQLVAAQGATKAILIEKIIASVDFVAAAYATNTQLEARYDGAAVADATGVEVLAASLDAILTATADKVQFINGLGAAEANAVLNKGVSAIVATADPVTGDSDVKLTVVYRIITL